jgi:kynurenine/2-aminoadipate aminotransferase
MTALNARRQPSAIRSLMPLLQIPGMISLGGGLPNPALFPFRSLSFGLAGGKEVRLSDAELNESLQYSPTPGLPKFVAQLRDLQHREHAPPQPAGSWSVSVSTGSSDALFKAFDLLVEEGDNVLIEAPTYSGSLAALKPLKANLIEIAVDEFGMIPSKLEGMMHTCSSMQGRAKPRVLYVIPTGQNPAGCTLTAQRKKEIYEIACRYDLIILEDDPYYFLVRSNAEAAGRPAVALDSVLLHVLLTLLICIRLLRGFALCSRTALRRPPPWARTPDGSDPPTALSCRWTRRAACCASTPSARFCRPVSDSAW